MKLSRIGAKRKESRGVAFDNQKPEISCDGRAGEVKLVVRYADGMGAQGQCDCTVCLDTNDIASLLSTLSEQREAFEAGPIQDLLRQSSASLIRLLFAGSSLPFQLRPTQAQLMLQKLETQRTAISSGQSAS